MIKKCSFSILIATLLLFFATITCVSAAEISESKKIALLTKLIPHTLERIHYLHKPFNDQQSALTFEEYFILLDPAKSYFTQEDIDSFEAHRYTLDDETEVGISSFAFEVYALYLERLDLYKKFAEAMLASPSSIDFTIDEAITLDRQAGPYCANMAELEELWRKRVKYEVLANRLIQRALEYQENNPELLASLSEEERKDYDRRIELAKAWQRTPEEQVLRRLHDLHNNILQRDQITVLGIFLTALARTYDPHSDYMAPVADTNFDITMKLSLEGIGAKLTSDDGYIKVAEIIPGGPAARDGVLQAGDRIIAVQQENGEPVSVIDMSLDRAVSMIRGAGGTKVTLSVLPGGKGRGAMPEQVTIVRGKVELNESAAKSKIYEMDTPAGTLKIGLITLDSFYRDFEAEAKRDPNFKSCTRDVEALLASFSREGVQGVIIDMRNNGGGSLVEAVELSGLFIEKGPVVQVRRANDMVAVEEDRDPKIAFDGPLVILTSKLTCSSAEIFSAALRDYDRALLMGDTRTYGKGSVQELMKIDRLLRSIDLGFDAGSLKFSTSKFYRINGESTQFKGVATDIVFPSFTEDLEIGEVFSRNPLEWDSIKPARYSKFAPAGAPGLAELRDDLIAASIARTLANPAVIKHRESIAEAAAARAIGEISLNEDMRFAEYVKELERESKLVEGDVGEEIVPIPEDRDLLLAEALNVLVDWIGLAAR